MDKKAILTAYHNMWRTESMTQKGPDPADICKRVAAMHNVLPVEVAEIVADDDNTMGIG